MREVIKRDGTKQEYDFNKILTAIGKAFGTQDQNKWITDTGKHIVPVFIQDLKTAIGNLFDDQESVSVEDVQDAVEKVLMLDEYYDVAKKYILYRSEHNEARFIRERIDYMDKYSNSSDNAASSSETDANSNVTLKNVANLEGEVYKTTNRIIQRQRMKDELNKLFPEVAKQYEKDLDHHIIYTHDEATSPVLKQYCMAVSLYPLMAEGVGNIDGITPTPPNDLQSFSGQITNLIFLLSSQCKGAVAVGEYFVALNYYIVKEYGNDWYDHIDDVITTNICKKERTIRDAIYKAFKQFIYGINQPAGNRSFQSPFTNISYFDKTYFNSLFADFYYPDNTKPEWKAINILQKMFMKFFNKLRTTQILTFPVETMAMVYDPKTNDIIDQEYKDFTAEMYAEGHSFFTYISDSADSLSSCCFSGEQKVLWKSSTTGVHLTSLKELYNTKWEPEKKNLKIFHNGSWVAGKAIKLPNRKMYEIETFNNKKFFITDNHINVTLDGEKETKNLTTNDYLMFNTSVLNAVPENDEKLTYEQGFVIGAFLGDGSFGSTCENGIIYDVNFSQNKDKYEKLMNILDVANKQLGNGNVSKLNNIYNNVYPVRISSKELATFIIKWTNWKRGTYAYNKELNLNCLLQSIDFRKGILDGWYNTDGGNSNRCYTTSSKLAEDMEVLITSLGMQSIINISDRTDESVIIREKEYSRNYPLYCVKWYENGNNRVNKNVEKSWIKKNNSIFFRIKNINEYEYSDDVYCIECNNIDEPYFTLPSGLITHNCRLRNQLTTNTFSPTSGLTGIMTGSCNVITLNINRIIQDCYKAYELKRNCDWKENTSFLKNYLIDILSRVYKYHIAYKTMLYDLEDKGMLAASNGGYIHISKLYSTIGINGLNEAAKFLGLSVSNNKEYIDFLQFILGTIKEQNTIHSIRDKKRPFIFNSEVVPAESLGGKNYRWDKEDGYIVPEDENLYNSYFYDAHDNTSVLDKFILHGKQTCEFTDGR